MDLCIFFSILSFVGRIPGDSMVVWEERHGCSYRHFGSDNLWYGKNWTDAVDLCSSHGANVASAGAQDQWLGIKEIMEACEAKVLTIHGDMKMMKP